MKNESKCPVCGIELIQSEDDNNQTCPKCRREFYPLSYEDNYNKEENDSHIETLSANEANEGPVILCEKEKNKPDPFSEDYLKRRLGNHVSVETELYIPE
jgi:uncharacterized Zn finger protein (UPF0148 family)